MGRRRKTKVVKRIREGGSGQSRRESKNSPLKGEWGGLPVKVARAREKAEEFGGARSPPAKRYEGKKML